jgi:type II secretory pathway predicted ATPase ExeA
VGIGLAALLEYRDTSLRNEMDIWAFTKLPTLAIISHIDDLTEPRRQASSPQMVLALTQASGKRGKLAVYKSFFGLRVLPFGASPDPRFLCMMPQIREALACLQYGIAARKGFVVMTGEVGTGKTTLLKTVLSTFSRDRVSSAFVFNPRLDVLDFLEFVLTDFGIPPKTRTKSGMLLQLNRWLIERYRNADCASSLSTKRRTSPGNCWKRSAC